MVLRRVCRKPAPTVAVTPQVKSGRRPSYESDDSPATNGMDLVKHIASLQPQNRDSSDSDSDVNYSQEILRRDRLGPWRESLPQIERDWILPTENTVDDRKTLKDDIDALKDHAIFAALSGDSHSDDDLLVTDICDTMGLSPLDRKNQPINSTLAENGQAKNIRDISLGPSVSLIATDSNSSLRDSEPFAQGPQNTSKEVLRSIGREPRNSTAIFGSEPAGLSQVIPDNLSCISEDLTSIPRQRENGSDVISIPSSRNSQKVSEIGEEGSPKFGTESQSSSTKQPAQKKIRLAADYSTKTVKVYSLSPTSTASGREVFTTESEISPHTLSTIKGFISGELGLQYVSDSTSQFSFIDRDPEALKTKTSSPFLSSAGKVTSTLPTVQSLMTKAVPKRVQDSQGFSVPRESEESDRSELEHSHYSEQPTAYSLSQTDDSYVVERLVDDVDDVSRSGPTRSFTTADLDAILHGGDWTTDEWVTATTTNHSTRDGTAPRRQFSTDTTPSPVASGNAVSDSECGMISVETTPSTDTHPPDVEGTPTLSLTGPWQRWQRGAQTSPSSRRLSVSAILGSAPDRGLGEAPSGVYTFIDNEGAMVAERGTSSPVASLVAIGAVPKVCPPRSRRAGPTSRLGPVKPARRRICQPGQSEQDTSTTHRCFLLREDYPHKTSRHVEALSWIARPGKDFVFAALGDENDCIEAF